MKLDRETFLDHFGQLTQSPEGIDKLRNLALWLAFNGMLLPEGIAEWTTSKLGDTVELNMGQSPKGEHTNNLRIGVPLIGGASDLGLDWPQTTKWTEKPTKLCKRGDIILCVRATIGKTNLADKEYCLGRGVAGLRAHKLSADWLRNLLEYLSDDLIAAGKGATFKQIDKKTLNNWNILYPANAETQARVIERLNELMEVFDDLEEQQKRHVKLKRDATTSALYNLSKAQNSVEVKKNWSILSKDFNAWFDDIETVNRLSETILKLAVRGALSKPSQLTKRRNGLHNRFNLSALAEVLGGGTPSKKNSAYWGGNIPWVSPKDMKTLEITGSQDNVTQLALDETVIKMVPIESVLVVVRGMILAKKLPVSVTRLPVTINQDMKAFITKPNILPEFLALSLRGHEELVMSQVERSSHGTCRLQTERLLNLNLWVPSPEEQKRIVKKVNRLMTLCAQLENQIRVSHSLNEELMEALINRLTGGQKREVAAKEMKMRKEIVALIELEKTAQKKTLSDSLLGTILQENNMKMNASELWKRTNLSIDAFYAALKHEIEMGYIKKPQPAKLSIIE